MKNSFIDSFSSIEDPRIERRKLYPLIEIIFLTICAVVSGANYFTEIVIFGEANLDWLRKYLPFKNGIPSHDAIGYFFSKLNPENCQQHLGPEGLSFFTGLFGCSCCKLRGWYEPC